MCQCVRTSELNKENNEDTVVDAGQPVAADLTAQPSTSQPADAAVDVPLQEFDEETLHILGVSLE